MDDPGNDLERLRPYLEDFAEAAMAEGGEDVALLCAVCLRETAAGWAGPYWPKGTHLGRGDGATKDHPELGHGFGLFQIDDRGPYARLPVEAPGATPFLQARWACTVLRDARRELSEFKAHPLFERGYVDAYNAGSPRVARCLRIGVDPDLVTHGGDYGTDVLARRLMLRSQHPDVFPPYRREEMVA